jgi:hypothetical protein
LGGSSGVAVAVGGKVGFGVGLGGRVAVAVGDGVAVGTTWVGLGDGLAMFVGVGPDCELEAVATSVGSTVGAGAPEPEQLSGAQVKVNMTRRQISGICLCFIFMNPLKIMHHCCATIAAQAVQALLYHELPTFAIKSLLWRNSAAILQCWLEMV